MSSHDQPVGDEPDRVWPIGTEITDLRAYFRDHQASLRRQVARYYADSPPSLDPPGRRRSTGYSGRWFDRLRLESPISSFAPVDFLAAEALSVQLPPHAVAAILLTERDYFDGLLRQIPEATALWEVAHDELSPGAPLQQLYEALRTFDDVDAVKASKLLALKRPALVPIYDRAVRTFLAPPRGGFWALVREWLSDEVARDEIMEATSTAPSGVGLLRRLDVAIWMQVEHPEKDG
ncbi:MAG: hypothetical protein KDB04_15250 [Acidimicrobiales bacterium]|nr:hypothetical protein [Acidimicrobiales bacterium]